MRAPYSVDRGPVLESLSGEGGHSPSAQDSVSYKSTRHRRGASGTEASSRPVLAVLDCTIIALQTFLMGHKMPSSDSKIIMTIRALTLQWSTFSESTFSPVGFFAQPEV